MARAKMSLKGHFGGGPFGRKQKRAVPIRRHHAAQRLQLHHRLSSNSNHKLESPAKEQPTAGPPDPNAALARRAEHMLHSSPYPAMRRLRCSFQKGELVIAGSANSYYVKQLAQFIVQKLDGVERISNIVEVIS
jgi:hypothetical protein